MKGLPTERLMGLILTNLSFLQSVNTMNKNFEFQKIKDLRAAKPQAGDSISMRIARKALFLTSVGRNALVVIVAGIIAFAAGQDVFTLTGMYQMFYMTI